MTMHTSERTFKITSDRSSRATSLHSVYSSRTGSLHSVYSSDNESSQLCPEAKKCSMFGPALEPNAVLTIGKPINFSVDTSDTGSEQLTVKAVGPGGVQATVFIAKSSKQGVHDIKLDPVQHGNYLVSVKWSGEHIPGSPFPLEICPGADASKCKAYGPGLEDGFVGNERTFTIKTKDARTETLNVSLRIHGVTDVFKIETKWIDRYTCNARYSLRKPDVYLITIKWADKNIPGSPFHIKIAEEGREDESQEISEL